MSKSIRRVQAAAEAAGLEIEVKRMGESTRTAEEAAAQCGCSVAQIVKSLIFQGEESGKLYLFLVSGSRQLALDKASALVGEALKRADPRHIREVTGFAIGGVSPLGQPDDVLPNRSPAENSSGRRRDSGTDRSKPEISAVPPTRMRSPSRVMAIL